MVLSLGPEMLFPAFPWVLPDTVPAVYAQHGQQCRSGLERVPVLHTLQHLLVTHIQPQCSVLPVLKSQKPVSSPVGGAIGPRAWHASPPPAIAVSGAQLSVKRRGQGPSQHSSVSPVGPQENGTTETSLGPRWCE